MHTFGHFNAYGKEIGGGGGGACQTKTDEVGGGPTKGHTSQWLNEGVLRL
jgi:hypothetical protein